MCERVLVWMCFGVCTVLCACVWWGCIPRPLRTLLSLRSLVSHRCGQAWLMPMSPASSLVVLAEGQGGGGEWGMGHLSLNNCSGELWLPSWLRQKSIKYQNEERVIKYAANLIHFGLITLPENT